MSAYDSFTKAHELAWVLHHGQKDKRGRPYIRHVEAVAARVAPELRTIALLHDVIEDTPATLQTLEVLGFDASVVRAVDVLTRREGEVYIHYISRIVESGNPAALRVKLADMEDHMVDCPPELEKRYTPSLIFLRAELDRIEATAA